MIFKFRVDVRLKAGVADPQGSAVHSCLQALGRSSVRSVAIGKRLDVSLEASDVDAAKRELSQMCDETLVNTVMETYELTLIEGEDVR